MGVRLSGRTIAERLEDGIIATDCRPGDPVLEILGSAVPTVAPGDLRAAT